MPEMIIDYLTFSLKPDQQAYNKREVDLAFITDFLKLGGEWLNFENKGGRNGYPTCYEYNDVLIHAPAPEHYERMGYCVMMKDNGIRWYASLFQDFNIAVFLRDLVSLTDTGLSLNVSRIDVAMDDKDGALDLDIISEKALTHEYVSQSREKQVVRCISILRVITFRAGLYILAPAIPIHISVYMIRPLNRAFPVIGYVSNTNLSKRPQCV